jgi:hypothetical protein
MLVSLILGLTQNSREKSPYWTHLDWKIRSLLLLMPGLESAVQSPNFFAQAGAKVVVSDLKVEIAQGVVESIHNSSGAGYAVACDVTENAGESIWRKRLSTHSERSRFWLTTPLRCQPV